MAGNRQTRASYAGAVGGSDRCGRALNGFGRSIAPSDFNEYGGGHIKTSNNTRSAGNHTCFPFPPARDGRQCGDVGATVGEVFG
jgi:hypothetical protein